MKMERIQVHTRNDSPELSRPKRVLLGIIASLALLSTGDTSTDRGTASHEPATSCDGTEIVVGDTLGVGDGNTYKACVTFTDKQEGNLRHN
jgi:hypothetical protein